MQATEAERLLLSEDDLQRTLRRIAHEIVEGHPDISQLALVGIYTRGVTIAQRLRALIEQFAGVAPATGALDITFYRDDVAVRTGEQRAHPQPVVKATRLDFPLEGKSVVIVDDVLYTGRTIRAAIEALFDYGRPAAGAARRARSTAATASCRSAPTTSARTCPPPATSGSTWS